MSLSLFIAFQARTSLRAPPSVVAKLVENIIRVTSPRLFYQADPFMEKAVVILNILLPFRHFDSG